MCPNRSVTFPSQIFQVKNKNHSLRTKLSIEDYYKITALLVLGYVNLIHRKGRDQILNITYNLV